MPITTKNRISPVCNKKVANLCSEESDSNWLIKNMAKEVYQLEGIEKIIEKIRKGEIDTIFFRASKKSAANFKLIGQLLRDAEAKANNCQFVIVDDTDKEDLTNYVFQKMDELFCLLDFKKERMSFDGLDCQIYA